MTPEYDVRLDDREYRVRIRKLDEGGLLVVSVGDETFTLKTAPGQEGVWTVSDQSSHHQVKIVRRMGRNVTVELDGEEKELEWGRVRTQESSSQKRSSSPGGRKVAGGVYPPMPGRITEVRVGVGDAVDEGQTVCVLEAMKMFNELKAPISGTVKEVTVEPGTTVTPDDLLVLIG